MTESTLFSDKNDQEIFLGDRVRMSITGNQDFHGEWADYRVVKRPGGY